MRSKYIQGQHKHKTKNYRQSQEKQPTPAIATYYTKKYTVQKASSRRRRTHARNARESGSGTRRREGKVSAADRLAERAGRTTTPEPRVNTRRMKHMLTSQHAHAVQYRIPIQANRTRILSICQSLPAAHHAQRANGQRVDTHVAGPGAQQPAQKVHARALRHYRRGRRQRRGRRGGRRHARRRQCVRGRSMRMSMRM